MPNYLVHWRIDIEAENPLEAAKEALKIQRDPESIATVFGVTDKESKETCNIDAWEKKCHT